MRNAGMTLCRLSLPRSGDHSRIEGKQPLGLGSVEKVPVG